MGRIRFRSGAIVWLAAALAMAACGDDAGNGDAGNGDAGNGDAGNGDAGIPDAAMDSGPDAGRADAASDGAALDAPADDGDTPDAEADGGAPPPGVVLAEEVCGGPGQLAVSGDGARAAYVTCPEGSDGAVWVQDLPGGEPVELGAAGPDDRVAFSPDGASVVYGSDSLGLRAADASAEAVALTEGTAFGYRFFEQGAEEPVLRMLVLEELAGGARRITARSETDGFASATTLIEDENVRGGLELVSASGNSLIIRYDEGVGERYYKVDTGAAEGPGALAFGPGEWVLGPGALGDTHGLGRGGAQLAFVEFETAAAALLVDGGLLAGDDHIFVLRDGSGTAYAYFIADGDPSRRVRNASSAIEVLATANATMQVSTPDGQRVAYVSDGTLFTTGSDGSGSAVTVVADVDAAEGAHVAFAPSSDELAVVTASGELRRAPVDGSAEATAVDGPDVLARSVGYNGDGSRLLWSRPSDGTGRVDVLRATGAGGAATLAWNVADWWAVPGSADVLYLASDGTLRLLAL